jgi:hypothetical protein
MSWEGFMKMERMKVWERRAGKLRRALGRPLPGESMEQLDHIGGEDQLRAHQGLVPIKGKGPTISYKHIDDLHPLEMRFVTAAEREEVEWLKERVERRKQGAEAPPIPTHLLRRTS